MKPLRRAQKVEELGGCLRGLVPSVLHSLRRRFLEVSAMSSKKQEQVFPLDFNAESWTLEEAVRYVFFGDYPASESGEWAWATEHVLAKLTDADLPGEDESNSLLAKKRAIELIKFLHPLVSKWQMGWSYSPMVWSRVAIQYWLKKGGCQKRFLNKLVSWLYTTRRNVWLVESIFPAGKMINGGRAKEVDAAIYLLGAFDINKAIYQKTEKKTKSSIAKKSRKKLDFDALKAKFGPNACECVKSIVEDAISSGNILNLTSRLDPETGRYQFTGRHPDLLNDVCRQYSEEIDPYARSTVDRVLRGLVASRRSWKGIV